MWIAPATLFASLVLTFPTDETSSEKVQINSKSDTAQQNVDTQSIPLINHGDFFGIEVEVGTPPQKVQLLLDTGSDQTWIPSINNPLCSQNDRSFINKRTPGDSEVKKDAICDTYGVYNEKLSSTANVTEEQFFVSYLDDTSVRGTLAHDTFIIPGITGDNSCNIVLENAQFGYGNEANGTIGVMGLSVSSFKNIEGSAVYDRQNIVHQMKSQCLLERRVFSIWLNRHLTEAGSILFGAVDYEKFTPPLKSIKMVNTNANYGTHVPVRDYEVIISSVFVKTPDNYNSGSGYDLFQNIEIYKEKYSSAIFDTGSYFTYFPQAIYDRMLHDLKGYTVERDGSVYIECLESRQVSDSFAIIFKFGTTSMEVPFDFLIDHIDTTDTGKIMQDGISYCKLNIKPLVDMINNEYDDKIILGQGVLRSMYTVYDLDKFEISIAPARFTESSRIVNITLIHDIESEDDGMIDKKLLPDLYNQKLDFIENTRENGFLKPLKNGVGASLFDGPSISAVLSMVIGLCLIV